MIVVFCLLIFELVRPERSGQGSTSSNESFNAKIKVEDNAYKRLTIVISNKIMQPRVCQEWCPDNTAAEDDLLNDETDELTENLAQIITNETTGNGTAENVTEYEYELQAEELVVEEPEEARVVNLTCYPTI